MLMLNVEPISSLVWGPRDDCTVPDPSKSLWRDGVRKISKISAAEAAMTRSTETWRSPMAVKLSVPRPKLTGVYYAPDMTHEFEPVEEPQGDGGLSTRQKINLVLIALLGIALALFIVQNPDGQDVEWLSFKWNLPMWLIVLGSALAGAVLSTVGRLVVGRRRSKNK